MRRTGMVLGLFGLTLGLTACPGDDTEGTGTDGDTDMTSTTAMTTTPMTTSPSTSTTTPTTDMTTTPMTTDMTTDVTSDTSTDTDPSATGTGSTGTEDMCTPCIEENCGKQIETCAGVKECACWIDCAASMGTPDECAEMCGGAPPPRFDELFGCIGRNCTEECSGGGTGTTGGEGGAYLPCEMDDDCGDGFVCNTFLNFCTVDCEGNDPDSCPEPTSGDATLDCGPQSGQCVLDCSGGADCPEGLECMMAGLDMFCAGP